MDLTPITETRLTERQKEILRMVQQCNGNQSEAARRLGVSQAGVRQTASKLHLKLDYAEYIRSLKEAHQSV
jgi:DNA-directed RNA polymerase specialized sigma subunit